MRGLATIVRSDSFRYATYSLRRSPLAMVGIGMILVVVLVAAFAPAVAPHPEQVYKVNLKQKLLPPAPSIGSAPTTWDATWPAAWSTAPASA